MTRRGAPSAERRMKEKPGKQGWVWGQTALTYRNKNNAKSTKLIVQRRRRTRAFALGQRLSGVALLAALLAGCDNSVAHNAPPPPPVVSAASVVVKPISQWDAFNGRVEAVQSVQLRPRVSGYIERVNYTEGDEVKKGQVLFTIDDRTYRAAREQAQAELVRARNQAALARSESSRTEKLIGTQAISQEVWEQRRSSAAQAQSNVLAAQAQLDMAQLNLDFTRVTAPIDGRASRAMITAATWSPPVTAPAC